ncbi:pentatricopeptide repeat-containing protein At1g02370, mitochondrial-like [Trifolium pratense]|uniref:pentatricopeptide repeat-containing protein At1g02370, mitochondrial-like n=1 Tax=Trifolium pratense TaxID=57577 RepID=UPI001E695E15|nr:pentatricopeptide repeat-containing protein At1g02370, mitochondrial-like [Trifolium pratense]
MNYNRLISGGGRLLRRLSTEATVAEIPKRKPSLYQKLAELEKTGGTVSQTLNRYIMEGKAVGKGELEKCVEELRKYRRFQHAFEILEWMMMRKINFSWDNYAVYLDLMSKVKGVIDAENYFNSLPNPAKNKYTWGSLLNCYCKELMLDKALSHFEKMDELGFVTSLSFTNLMTLYMKLGQPLKVHELVNDMKVRKMRMTGFTYIVWMNSCAALNDLDGVENVYKEMKRENGDKIDWKTYSNLAAIYVKAGEFVKAELMLKKMEQVVRPQQRETYHCLLSLYGGTGNVTEVYRVWSKLKTVSPVTNRSYLIMLSTLRRLEDMQGIIKLFKEWESRRVNYDPRLVSVAVETYLSQNRDEEAVSLFKEVLKTCRGPFFRIREMFMVSLLEKGQLDGAMSHLEAALSEVSGDKYRPSPQVVSAFLMYYEDKTDLDGVDELSKILRSHNFDESCITACITASESSPGIHPVLKEDSYTDHVPRNL